MISRFVANLEKCCKYAFLGGSAQIITILHKGGYKIYYNIARAGLPNLLQYYNGGGSLGTPTLYYVIYGLPLKFRTPGPPNFKGTKS